MASARTASCSSSRPASRRAAAIHAATPSARVRVAGATADKPVESGSCLPVHGIREHAGGT